MATEKISQLPLVTNAQLTDIIPAVQNQTTVQESLQQVANLMLSNTILNFPGNPNQNLAGQTYQLCYDTVSGILWVCITTGSISTAVWQPTSFSPTSIVTPEFGGTGVSDPPAHGIAIAEGSANFNFLPMTNGQILIGSTGNDPVANFPTNGNNISWTAGAGTLEADLTGTVQSVNGGTGISSPPAHTLPVAQGSGAFNFYGPMGNGQLFIGRAGNDPAINNLTAGENITIVNNPGNIIISGVSASSKDACEVATTGFNLNANYSNGVSGVGATLTDASGTFIPLVIDSINVQIGDRILVKDQSSKFQNGIYILTTNGDGISIPWQMTRATDYDGSLLGPIAVGDYVMIALGIINQGQIFIQYKRGPFSVGSTLITFTGIINSNNSLALGNMGTNTGSANNAFAFGKNVSATGLSSFAMGDTGTTAAGENSIAIGSTCTALEVTSTSIGLSCNAQKNFSTAWGSSCSTNGEFGMAYGQQCSIVSDYSFAWGNLCTAGNTVGNQVAWAQGNGCSALGNFSWALGNGSRANDDGSVAWGDNLNTAVSSGVGTYTLKFSGGYFFYSGPLHISKPGAGLQVAEGSNAKQGAFNMSGSATQLVNNSSVTSSSRIFLTGQDTNVRGTLSIDSRVPGTSFTVRTSNAADTGVVAFEMFEPA